MDTIASLLQDGKKILGIERVLDCEVLLAHVLKKTREFLVGYSDAAVSVRDCRQFLNFVSARAQGKPVAYLVHEKEFYGLSFFVDERVLVPRPETETLIDVVLSVLRHFPKTARVLDVGTGSGCIAITLAQRQPELSITAVDISKRALQVAKKNAQRHAVSVRFLQSDLLDSVFQESFDVVVANLPYLSKDVKKHVEEDVKKYEPHTALFGGSNGLEQYERLFKQFSSHHHSPKYIVFEFAAFQIEPLTKLLEHYFSGRPTAIIKDSAGHDRVCLIQL